MPSITLPVLAIKEANDHLQALFEQNQRLESEVVELRDTLKQAQEENKTLNEHLKTINERVSILRQEHVESINSLTESLKIESDKRLYEQEQLAKEEEEKLLDDLQTKFKLHEEEMLQTQKDLLQTEQEKKLSDLENLLKAEEAKKLHDLENRLKAEEKKKLEDLKAEEKKKICDLEKIIEDERRMVSMLENEIANLHKNLIENTRKREDKVAILNNVFKSTIENMSFCLSITNENDFVYSHCGGAFTNIDMELPENSNRPGKVQQNYVCLQDEGLSESDSGIQDVSQSNEGRNRGDREHHEVENQINGKLNFNTNISYDENEFYTDHEDLQNQNNDDLENENNIELIHNVVQSNDDLEKYFTAHNGESAI